MEVLVAILGVLILLQLMSMQGSMKDIEKAIKALKADAPIERKR
tara:strand:- start:44 stop:175 length:132 start_codon:yes stop_codon:yes gene_type:complete